MCVDSCTHSQKPNESHCERNTRLVFPMCTWMLKSPTIITLSVLRTRAERKSESPDRNSEKGPVLDAL